HLRNAKIADIGYRSGELAPEIAQHVLPSKIARGDQIELLLEVRGKIVFDIALEEAFEEGRHEASFVLGDEPLFIQTHIEAVTQHVQSRGIGRWPADAELFHLLDQSRL